MTSEISDGSELHLEGFDIMTGSGRKRVAEICWRFIWMNKICLEKASDLTKKGSLQCSSRPNVKTISQDGELQSYQASRCEYKGGLKDNSDLNFC